MTGLNRDWWQYRQASKINSDASVEFIRSQSAFPTGAGLRDESSLEQPRDLRSPGQLTLHSANFCLGESHSSLCYTRTNMHPPSDTKPTQEQGFIPCMRKHLAYRGLPGSPVNHNYCFFKVAPLCERPCSCMKDRVALSGINNNWVARCLLFVRFAFKWSRNA